MKLPNLPDIPIDPTLERLKEEAMIDWMRIIEKERTQSIIIGMSFAQVIIREHRKKSDILEAIDKYISDLKK